MARIHIELPVKFSFSTEISIRIGDINYGGHLAHDSVLSLTHEARVRYLDSMGYTEGNVEGVGIIISDAAIVYRSEAFYGQILNIEIAAQDFNKYGCDFLYKLSDIKTKKEIARVKTGIVFFDYNSRKITPIPKGLINRLKTKQ
jgi:acyl-CoA thioester hydrolase